MATLYKTDGTSQEVQPNNGKNFKLEELYELVGCRYIEMIPVSDTEFLIVDEEGKLVSPPKRLNIGANAIFRQWPRLPGEYIVGDALLCTDGEVD